ncbi:hypothetical protein [Janibacter sp. GXQ6167]|uniref:hypothetical protein n=1 Tax=Janibacter sp. GXQ6167 TaxID=3240791 RepID=UPI0035241B89
MTDLPTPSARRLARPGWRDPRLLAGVLLVLASVVVGIVAFGAVDERQGYWAAARDLTPGQVLGEQDLVRTDVQLGDSEGAYLGAETRPEPGVVLDRVVRRGELIPRAALVPEAEVDLRSVAVHVDPIYVTGLRRGSVVSVYAAAAPDQRATREDAEPRYELALEHITVHEIPDPGRRVIAGSERTQPVVLLIPAEEVEAVLSLDRSDAALKLVAERIDAAP